MDGYDINSLIIVHDSRLSMGIISIPPRPSAVFRPSYLDKFSPSDLDNLRTTSSSMGLFLFSIRWLEEQQPLLFFFFFVFSSLLSFIYYPLPPNGPFIYASALGFRALPGPFSWFEDVSRENDGSDPEDDGNLPEIYIAYISITYLYMLSTVQGRFISILTFSFASPIDHL